MTDNTNDRFVFERTEVMVGKGENALYQDFLPFFCNVLYDIKDKAIHF